MAPDRVLVVGANGFLGSALCGALVEMDLDVTAVYRSRDDRIPSGVRNRFSIYRLNAIGGEFDWVFIAAAFIPLGRFDDPDTRLVESNVGLPIEVCTRFGSARVVLASSVLVYGEPPRDGTALREDTPPAPMTLYAQSRLAGEVVVRNHPSHAVVRFAALYGPGMRRTALLPRFVDAALETGVIALPGDGSRTQDYLHVDDAAQLCIAAATAAGDRVLLGVAGDAVSNRELAELVAAQVVDTELADGGRDAGPAWSFDPSATREFMPFRPKISLERGIQELLRSYSGAR